MADTLPRGTPEFWLQRLYPELVTRWEAMRTYDRYYEGKHKLAFATPKFRATFGRLFREFADNWCDLIVDASVERLSVEGFRFGNEDQADKDAWELWQRSHLDADSRLAHHEAVKLGESAVIVEPSGKWPRITVEHPSQVIVARAAADRRARAAALKAWLDESGRIYATVFTPKGVYKFQSAAAITDGYAPDGIKWQPRSGVEFATRHRLGMVPVFALRNNPTMLGGGRSDLAKAIPIQDAINKLVTDMLVASEYAAFPQRWATGLEIPTDDDGEPIDTDRFLSFVGRVWAVEDPDAKFGDFTVADLSIYVRAVEMLVQHLAAQTRTPPHYLLGQSGAFPSGESLKATETGLVAKVQGKHLDFGETWEDVVRCGFLAKGDRRRAEAYDAETIWKDPESRTVGEQVDAGLKEKELGVPLEDIWERRLDASPQQVQRWTAKRQAEILAAEALAFAGAGPGDQGLPREAPAGVGA
jgi:hypothetical protein